MDSVVMFEDLPTIEANEITASVPDAAPWEDDSFPYTDLLEASPNHHHPEACYWAPEVEYGASPEPFHIQPLPYWSPSAHVPALSEDHASRDESPMGSVQTPSETHPSFPSHVIASGSWPAIDDNKPVFGASDERYDRGVHPTDIQPWIGPFANDQDQYLAEFEEASPRPPYYEQHLQAPRERGHSSEANTARTPESEAPTEHISDSGSDYTPEKRPKRASGAHHKQRRRLAKAAPRAKNKVSKRQPDRKKHNDCAAMAMAAGSFTKCTLCPHEAESPTLLQKHVILSHTRPYKCAFSLYGCQSTFGSKNEWKRHVSSQHIRPEIWRCDLDGCPPPYSEPGTFSARASPPSRSTAISPNTDLSRSSPSPTQDPEEEQPKEHISNDFNRKDLFTQHLKRMHRADMPAGSSTDRAKEADWLRRSCERCLLRVRGPPPRSACGYCEYPVSFEGASAWEHRMEHVGKHLETNDMPCEWREDEALREWMCDEGLLESTEDGQHVLVAGATGGRGR